VLFYLVLIFMRNWNS